MSWARLLASGAGTIAWRLSIEGWLDDFVSHRGMEGPVLPRNVRTVAQALSLTTSSGNLLPAPGSVTWTPGTSVTVTTGQADPAGGTNAVKLDEAHATGVRGATTNAATYASGNDVWASVWIGKDATALNFAQVAISYDAGTTVHSAVVRLDTGAAQVRLGSLADLAVIDMGGWWFVAMRSLGASASTVAIEVSPAIGLVASYPTVNNTATGSVTVYGARVVDADAVVRGRLVGLTSEGFKFSESVDLVRAKWEAQGLRVVIAASPQVTASFSTAPTASTYLDADETAIDATLNAKSTAGFPSAGYLHLDTEAIVYTGKTATTFTGCGRGAWDTLAQYHYTVAEGSRQRFPEITDRPQILEGRRCRIYAYGAGDDKQGDGTLVWFGVASTDPAFDGSRWSFTIDPPSRLFDADIGSDLEDPTTIRGIYYPAHAPLFVRLEERSGATSVSPVLIVREFAIAGFWETQASFCAALTSALSSQMTLAGSFTQTVTAEPNGASWAFKFATAATPHWMAITISSAIDGPVATLPISGTGDGTGTATVTASTAYTMPITSFGGVPRAVFGSFASFDLAAPLPDAQKVSLDPVTCPALRLYIADGTGVTSTTEALQVEWTSSGLLAEEAGSEAFTATVASSGIDTSARSITLNRPSTMGVVGVRRYTVAGGELPSIRMGRSLGAATSGSALKGMIDALTGGVVQYLNTGAVPDLRSTDFGSLDEIASVAEYARLPRRGLTIFAEVSLAEIVEAECKLIGVFPCSDASGKITFRALRLPSPSEVAGKTLTATNVVVGDNLLSYEKNALGTFNTFVLRTGYDAVENDWTGPSIKVRDVAAYGLNPAARVVECAPIGIEDGSRITIDDVARLASRVLGVFGGPYALLTVEVPLTMMGTLLGDVVSVTWSKVPNGLGTLGVTDKLGIVVSREFEPMQAKGTLTILLTDQRIGGYAPSAKITNIDDVGGDSYVVTLDSSYFPSGTTAEDFFGEDYKIRVFEWNSTNTSNNATGTVTSASGNVVAFIADSGAWAHAGATWCLGYDVSTAISLAGQKRFVSLAGSDGDLDWSDSTDNPPFTFA